MQAVRQFTFTHILPMATRLTSAWLTNAQRSKTCLEKLLKPYNASPFKGNSAVWQDCGAKILLKW